MTDSFGKGSMLKLTTREDIAKGVVMYDTIGLTHTWYIYIYLFIFIFIFIYIFIYLHMTYCVCACRCLIVFILEWPRESFHKHQADAGQQEKNDKIKRLCLWDAEKHVKVTEHSKDTVLCNLFGPRKHASGSHLFAIPPSHVKPFAKLNAHGTHCSLSRRWGLALQASTKKGMSRDW